MMMWHTFGQPIGVMAVTVSFTAGGVLQRFPNLRAGLLEGNCGWAPWLLDRLDEHWEWVGDTDAPELERAPDDNLVFSTDYPHGDSKYPHAVEAFLTLPLDDDTKRKALWDNWCRLYDVAA
jgi:hypothetical protein